MAENVVDKVKAKADSKAADKTTVDKTTADNKPAAPTPNSAADKLIIVSSSWIRGTHDFIGKYKGKDNNYVYIEDPLALDYVEEKGIRKLDKLGPYHLPIGTVEVINQTNILALPHEYIGYFVLLPIEGDDWMHVEYESFFAPDAVGEPD